MQNITIRAYHLVTNCRSSTSIYNIGHVLKLDNIVELNSNNITLNITLQILKSFDWWRKEMLRLHLVNGICRIEALGASCYAILKSPPSI